MSKETSKRVMEECPLNVRNRNPGFSYRWVNVDRVEELKYKGYIVVETKLGEKNKEVPVGRTHTSQNAVRFKTLVLMKIPKKKYETAKKKKKEKTKEQIESIEQNFEEAAKKSKVQVVKEKQLN